MRFTIVGGAAAVAALVAGTALAAQYVYPAKGQSPQQQQKDEGECYSWAKNKTGIDPATGAGTQAPQQQGQVAKGVAKGAVRGAVAAEVVDGDSGRGAAAGAVIGGARGARNKQQQQRQAQSAAIAEFNKAKAACLEGRGYTVK